MNKTISILGQASIHEATPPYLHPTSRNPSQLPHHSVPQHWKPYQLKMLIQETHQDVSTKAGGDMSKLIQPTRPTLSVS